MEVHILRNILLICVLLLVCVQLSLQQRDYNEYDDIDDGLTPAPRARRPRPDRHRTSSRTRGRDNSRRERERQRETERREREREIERREQERQRSRQRVLYTTQGLLPPTTEPAFTTPSPVPSGRLDSCGCPANIEYSINSLNNYVETSTSDKEQTNDRLDKIEKQLQELRELVEKVDEESQNWKNSLRFPGLSALNSPTSIAFSDDAPRSTETFKDCQDVLDRGNPRRGIYQIKPESSAYTSLVFCQDGWTLLQRRYDGQTDFHKSYDDYIEGFGNFSGEFWLGLEIMHQLTMVEPFDLRIDLESRSSKFYYAVYSGFKVGNEDEDYRLDFTNRTSGNTRDGLRHNKGRGFSARDHDRDAWRSYSCANHYRSGFWLDRCGSDLNRDPTKGVFGGTKWGGRYVKSSLMRMKPARSMRPKDFNASP
ncbi:angiopoietin-related protein 1-like [Haliotis rubra]|uniref:angiopoietin-related protein 1-like n=1 Tax=Haliotis rubra TaxID=36100 RepID=UPI001EE5415B|nr:angiopoietin-related protein 1-like [Haliotis rubra]